MSVFVAAADESAGEKRGGAFYWCGFVAPEKDWSDYFAPAWQERVLDGPPSIAFLHQTDIRSPFWRRKHGLSDTDAERRIDEAFRVIASLGSLFPFGLKVDAAHFRSAFDSVKVVGRIGTVPFTFEPDYLCFLSFTFAVLAYISEHHRECETVDFVVERNRGITAHLPDFHGSLADGLEILGRPSLIRLVGKLIPSGKERVPVQAADLLCWYSQRYETKRLSDRDMDRYETIATRKGWRHEFTRDEISAFGSRAVASGAPSAS